MLVCEHCGDRVLRKDATIYERYIDHNPNDLVILCAECGREAYLDE